jgi:glycosyltransferase involved in cell wall biosynthesis
MKLSIIIPVCNVEKYIGPCLESICRQGLYDVTLRLLS